MIPSTAMEGVVLAAAVCGVLLQFGMDRQMATLDAFHMVFWFVSAVGLLGVLLGWGLGD